MGQLGTQQVEAAVSRTGHIYKITGENFERGSKNSYT